MVEIETDQLDRDELAAAYRDASESSETLPEQWADVSNEAWDELNR